MSQSLAYLQALKTYLAAQYLAAPPANGVLGTLKIGVFQADPEESPAVLTLHTHNPYDETFHDPTLEYVQDQQSMGGSDRGVWKAFGGQRETGGGGLYIINFWAKLDYFMTRTGQDQDEAWLANDALVDWLMRQINRAQPAELGLGETDGVELTETLVATVTTREGGGTPSSYIWKTLFRIRGLCYREA